MQCFFLFVDSFKFDFQSKTTYFYITWISSVSKFLKLEIGQKSWYVGLPSTEITELSIEETKFNFD
jgi:hypothetical protein